MFTRKKMSIIYFAIFVSQYLHSLHVPYLKSKFNDVNSFRNEKDIFLPSKLIKKHNFKLNQTEIGKLSQIKRTILKKAPKLHISNEEFSNIFKIKRIIQSHLEKTPYRSLFIERESDFLNYSLQFYKDGSSYIHFENKDPSRKKGGYKTFSRSIDISSGKLVANLNIVIKNTKDLQRIIREMLIMEDLKDTEGNLTYINYDLFKMKNQNQENYHFLFQTPLYDYDLGKKVNKNTSLKEQIIISYKTLSAIHQLHQKNYIHRDIKPQNIFVSGNFPFMEITLADYGLSQHKDYYAFGTSLAGTRGFIDPSMCLWKLKKKKIHAFSYEDGIKADIFSAGMTLLHIFLEEKPLHKVNTQINQIGLPKKNQKLNSANINDLLQSYNRKYREVISKKLTSQTKSALLRKKFIRLITNMIHPDPEKRPKSAYEVMVNFEKMLQKTS